MFTDATTGLSCARPSSMLLTDRKAAKMPPNTRRAATAAMAISGPLDRSSTNSSRPTGNPRKPRQGFALGLALRALTDDFRELMGRVVPFAFPLVKQAQQGMSGAALGIERQRIATQAPGIGVVTRLESTEGLVEDPLQFVILTRSHRPTPPVYPG